jgi:hypothetical protein
MITLKHLEIYKEYSGNLDAWLLKLENRLNNDNTGSIWSKISELMDELTIVKNGLAAESFKEQLMKKINEECENDDVVTAFLAIHSNKKIKTKHK